MVRQELARQCQLLYEDGRLMRDYASAALDAVPISALERFEAYPIPCPNASPIRERKKEIPLPRGIIVSPGIR